MSFKDIIIGTANMGDKKYGYNDKKVKNPTQLIKKIITKKFRYFDTAYSYKSEKNFLNIKNKKIKIFTKTIQIDNELKNLQKDILMNKLNSAISDSIKKLGNRLYCIYIHRVEDLFTKNKIILKILIRKKQENKIKKIGISLNNFSKLKKILSIPHIEYIQLPVNIFDYRWQKIFKYKKLIKQKKFVARSIFLQGIIFKPKKLWPKNIKKYYKKVNIALNKIQNKFPNKTLDEICFAYVNSLRKFDKIIFGVSDISNIDKISRYSKKKMKSSEISYIQKITRIIPKEFFMINKWKY